MGSASVLAESLSAVLEESGQFEVVGRPISISDRPISLVELARRDAVVLTILVVGDGDERGASDVIAAHRNETPNIPLVLVTHERVDPSRLVGWLQSGAADFLAPPFYPSSVLPRLWRLTMTESGADRAVREVKERLGLRGIIGRDPAFLTEMKRIPLMAACDAGVLIHGETGTGKEMVARSIHQLSRRSGHPFVAISCAGIPDTLADSILWGHVKGAFTGAGVRQQGLVAAAQGGTLLLDDVDCLPPAVQTKLLRFLQEREYRMLGSPKLEKADVRVIASSNRDLMKEVHAGRFRLDLYHRLNVLPVMLPPLRERPGDIPLLAQHFVAEHAHDLGVQTPCVPEEVLDRLLLHEWPGNVRELKHVMERAMVLRDGPELRASALMLPPPNVVTVEMTFQEAKARLIERFEKRYLERQMSIHSGNISRAARAAGKHRRAFFELLRKHEIDPHVYRA
jgi:DNA-binding NtrC family response regulator